MRLLFAVAMSLPTRTGVAVFLLSCAALVFQVAQTRLFSASLGYHLTFVAVSIALLGIGAGAAAAALLDRRPNGPTTSRLAALASASFVLAIGVTRFVDPAAGIGAAVVIIYAASSIPYLLVSWVVVRVLASEPARAGLVYAADLAGAATGGAIAFLAMSILGAPGEYGLAAALASAASLVLAAPRARSFVAIGLLLPTLVLTAGLAIAGDAIAPLRPAAFKPILQELARGGVVESSRWDPQGRVDVLSYDDAVSRHRYEHFIDPQFQGERPRARVVLIDLDAATVIVEGGSHANTAIFDASVLTAPYLLVERPTVLVIGPGGGIDILVALHGNASAVTGVDVNRGVISLVGDRYGAYAGGLFEDPRVTVVADEARSFVRRSGERYDMIVMTVVDSWAALQSGAYALSESYLYTEEAFADYARHLSSGGVLAVGRWYRDPPIEMVRLLSVAVAGLARAGVEDPEKAVTVVRNGEFAVLLARASPFDEQALERLRSFSAVHRFEMSYDPDRGGPLAAAFASSAPQGRSTDDRPFFFDTVSLALVIAGRAPLGQGHATLLTALAVAALLSLGAVLLPLRLTLRSVDRRLTWWTTAYGVALGAGFIAAELVLLQRLTLYLGQPTLALAVGLAALLLGSSIGAASATRVVIGARVTALAIAVTLVAVLTLLPLAADATLAAPLGARVGVAGLLAVALGVPLGTAFPRVLSAAGAFDRRLVAWAWGVNAVASVVGSIIAAGMALEVGFTGLAVLAVGCYLFGAVLGEAPAPKTALPDGRARAARPSSVA